MTLTEFLLARIAEDEAVAAAAVSRRDGVDKWEAVGSGTVVGPGYDKVKHVMLPSSEDGAARHIARHDPARVLAEVEAKRRIVGIHELDPIEVYSWGTTGGGCGLCDHSCETGGDTWGHDPCETLKALALPYADHPDYRQEWKP